MLIKIHIHDYFCVIAPFPNNPNPAEDLDPHVIWTSAAKA